MYEVKFTTAYKKSYKLMKKDKEKAEDKESGIVIEILQKGYVLKDRILRPAMVKVSE